MPTKKTTRHWSSKEMFLHLLVMIALYATAISVLTVLFQIINVYVVDPLLAYENYTGYSHTAIYRPLRFAIATLIVAYPLFFGLSWYLQKEYRRDPEQRQSRLRKFLIHFTLFVAALIMGGDLVSIVYNYLNGELTSRFLLKALCVLIVSGKIFGYYLWDVKQKTASPLSRLFGIGATIGVVALLVVGFVVIGSPQQQRAYRFDDERVNDLQSISYGIESYWNTNSKLPAALSDLQDQYTSSNAVTDPETDLPYAYRVVDADTYELCATFSYASWNTMTSDAPSPTIRVKAGYNIWDHGAGTVCFEKDIIK